MSVTGAVVLVTNREELIRRIVQDLEYEQMRRAQLVDWWFRDAADFESWVKIDWEAIAKVALECIEPEVLT